MTQNAARAARAPNAEAPAPGLRGRLALLFPGQGSQHPGMGKRIAETSKAARDVFDEADGVLGFSLSRLCFEGSAEELEDTVNTQPAIVTTSLAYLAYLRERLQGMGRRLRPSFLAGHSLGQYTAAVAANSLDLGEGLRLVRERGRVMGEWARKRPGGMGSVLGMSDREVRRACREASSEGTVGVAVVNGPGQTVISGDNNAVQRAMEIIRGRGGRTLRLPISVPGHSPVMREASRELSRFMARLSFRDPETPLVSNVSAGLLTTADEVRQELSDQICAAVQWARCVVTMANEGAGTFLEVGPGHALSRIVSRLRDDADALTVEEAPFQDIIALTEPLDAPTSIRARRRVPARPD